MSLVGYDFGFGTLPQNIFILKSGHRGYIRALRYRPMTESLGRYLDPPKDRGKVLTLKKDREKDQGKVLTPKIDYKIDRDKVLGTEVRFL